MSSRYYNIAEIEKDLEALDKEGETLKRKQAHVRVKRHRLRKLLKAAKAAE